VLGVAGLAVVAFGTGGQAPLAAVGLCLLAGLSWGIGNVVSRAARAPGGLGITVWSATVAPLPLLGLSLLIDGPAAVGHGLTHLGWHGVLSTVYTAGLCSLVGYALFNRLLARYPSASVVPWILLAPVVAMAAAWALLGEVPTAGDLAGAALLVVGVLVAQGIARPPGGAQDIGIRAESQTPSLTVTRGGPGRRASAAGPARWRRRRLRAASCR
jgi:O-acetylserine/cysteine efflux transporter